MAFNIKIIHHSWQAKDKKQRKNQSLSHSIYVHLIYLSLKAIFNLWYGKNHATQVKIHARFKNFIGSKTICSRSKNYCSLVLIHSRTRRSFPWSIFAAIAISFIYFPFLSQGCWYLFRNNIYFRTVLLSTNMRAFIAFLFWCSFKVDCVQENKIYFPDWTPFFLVVWVFIRQAHPSEMAIVPA